MTKHQDDTETLPQGTFATLVRPDSPALRYRRVGRRLACSAGDQDSEWKPCLPPVRVVMETDKGVTLTVVAPGHDFPFRGNPFEALSRHVGGLGLPGTLLTVLDATPTIDELLEALEDEHDPEKLGTMLGEIAAGSSNATTLETDAACPFPVGHAMHAALRAAGEWLSQSLDGMGWSEIPPYKRETLARAERQLNDLEDDPVHDAYRVAHDASFDLSLLGQSPDDVSSAWDVRVSCLAGRWTMLEQATSWILGSRRYADSLERVSKTRP